MISRPWPSLDHYLLAFQHHYQAILDGYSVERIVNRKVDPRSGTHADVARGGVNRARFCTVLSTFGPRVPGDQPIKEFGHKSADGGWVHSFRVSHGEALGERKKG